MSTGECVNSEIEPMASTPSSTPPSLASTSSATSSLEASSHTCTRLHPQVEFLINDASPPHNNSDSQYQLGQCYFDGYGSAVDVDYKLSFEWYLKAAHQGHVDAIIKVIQAYQYGRGLSQNEQVIWGWANKLSELGNKTGDAYIARGYLFGYGVAKDELKGYAMSLALAESGEAVAMNAVGYSNENALAGLSKNVVEATRWFKRAAETGNTSGVFNYGCALEYGTGCHKNESEAFQWYLKAASPPHCYPGAQFEIGRLYKDGIGVPKNLPASFDWFLKAALNGESGAMNSVGVSYKNGRGVAMDLKEASRWYQKSAEAGNEYGMFNYANALLNVTRDESRNLEMIANGPLTPIAIGWLLKSASPPHNYSLAQFDLGRWYYYGWYGLAEDYGISFEWFLKAAKQGHREAMVSVGNSYEIGRGVNMDLKRAARWRARRLETVGGN